MKRFSLNKINYIYEPNITYDLTTPSVADISWNNNVYQTVKRLFKETDLSTKHVGMTMCSLYEEILRRSSKILIKPNLVTHYHYQGKQAVLSTIVHGSILRPLLDFISLALNGSGSVIIADTPIEHADFASLMERSQIKDMVKSLSDRDNSIKVNVIDLRQKITRGNTVLDNKKCDPLGYAEIDLGKNSYFAEFDTKNDMHYYTLADRSIDHLNPNIRKTSITDEYHNSMCHKYIVAKSVLDADIIFNVAKLKTHCKAGVSLCLKNLIGIVSTKDCMPHHRPGPPPEGDAFPSKPPTYYTGSRRIYGDLRNRVSIHKLPGVTATINLLRKKKIIVGQQIEHGEWKGNDTIWRTILDVNRIAIYADKNGIMRDTPQRKFFHLIDGIIGQEGDAPISGTPKPCGVLVGGFNPVMVDALACKIMGIDYHMIKTITEATKLKKWPLLTEDVDLSFPDIETPNLHFEMPKGWR